jgi:hypothetical protein|tara:strand:+ start:506 stop:835 length:330 start_codon:yes stop_codon:yes gene_type:complete
MKATFTLKDRIALSNSLPTVGKYDELILREAVMKKISLSSEDLVTFKVTTADNGGMDWDHECKETWEYEFAANEANYICSQLKKRSNEGNLTIHHMNLYKTFIDLWQNE